MIQKILNKGRLRSIAAALLLASFFNLWLPALPAQARETNYFEPLADGYSRDQLVLAEPDLTRFYILQEQLLAMNAIQNQSELIKALMRYNREYSGIMVEVDLAHFAYYGNPAVYEDIYTKWQQLAAEAGQAYEETWRTMLKSDNRALFENLLPQEQITSMLNTQELSDEAAEQLQKINNMDNEYWRAMEAEYSVEVNGQAYNFETVNQLPPDQYLDAYLKLVRKRNQAVATVLAESVPVCNSFARSQGFANYADYTYAAVYGRDYTPADAARLHTVVKQRIVPLYQQVLRFQQSNPAFDQQALNTQYDFRQQQVVLETAAEYMPEISDEYANALTYLQVKDLLDINQSDTKLNVSFTTYIPYLNLALIFSGSQNGTIFDFNNFIHEFGHFVYYMYQQENIGLDISEYFAQGMELLFLNFGDDMFGQSGDTYRLDVLLQLLSAIVEGCLYDEFQQKIYQLEEPSVHDLNVLFHDLSLQYGYSYAHEDDEAYNWITTPHTFIQPFYYISYTTSALSAAELLVRSYNDFERAADTYLNMMANHRKYTYRAFFKEAGFADIFNPDELNKVADGLEAYVYQEICNVADFAELENHWARTELLNAAGLGLLQGDANGNLQANATATRAEVFSLLWRRFANKNIEAPAAGFSDVTPGVWYEQTANWAAAAELVTGLEGNRFAANQPMTREELVTVLYRLSNTQPDTETADLSRYADSATVSDWAAEALAWACRIGLIAGDENNLLQPQRPTTRAEMITIISKYIDKL